MPAAPATRAEIQRAIEAVQKAGLNPAGVSVAKDGTIHVEIEGQQKKANVVAPKQWKNNAR